MTVPFCKKCERTGIYEDWSVSPPISQPCECRDKVLAQRAAARWVRDVPPLFRDASLERAPVCFFEKPILTKLRSYVRNLDKRLDEGVGLWLGGPLGTGKTTAGWMLVLEARKHERSATLISLDQLLLELRNTYNDDVEETESELVTKLQQVDLLVIDDMAAIKATEAALRALQTIVNRRYEWRKATVITTDLTERELKAFIWPRTVDRLIAMTEEITFGGESHRRRPVIADDEEPGEPVVRDLRLLDDAAAGEQ